MTIKTKNIQGFTLLELMVTLSIAIVLTTIALPSFTGLIRDSRMTANVNDFLTSLNYARSEAVTRNEDVIIQSKSGINGDWKSGWDVYIDADSDGTIDVGELLKTHEELASGYTLTANAASLNTQVIYESSGLRDTTFGGSFFLCLNGDASTAKAIIVNNVGRARTEDAVTCS